MKILIVKMSSIGDIIHTMPALVAAKKAIPSLIIDWLVDENFIDLLKLYQSSNKNHNIINQILPIPLRKIKNNKINIKINFLSLKRNIKNLTQNNYELVIDAQGLIKSAIIAKFLVKKKKLAGLDFFSCKEGCASFLYDQKVAVSKDLHAIIRIQQLFAQALNYNTIPNETIDFGIDKNYFSLSKKLLVADIKNYIVFLHGTTWETKRWSINYWEQLAKLIINNTNLSIILMASNEQEVKFTKELKDLIINNISYEIQTRIMVLSNIDIFEVARVLAYAKAVVGVDTGFSHLAGAMGVTVIGIYGPSSILKAGILGSNCYNIQADYHCSPCFSRTCLELLKNSSLIQQPCLMQITPQLVFTKLQEILRCNIKNLKNNN